MFVLFLIIHILVAVVLVISIMLQSGQAGGLSGAFGGGGGGGNQTLFGGRGAATFLSKATTYLGAAFIVLSFMLALIQAHRTGGVTEGRNIIQESLPAAGPAPAAGEGIPASEGALPTDVESGAPSGGEGQTLPETDAPPAPAPSEQPTGEDPSGS